jgi:hypothetical protein
MMAKLAVQMKEAEALKQKIKKNFAGLRYGG